MLADPSMRPFLTRDDSPIWLKQFRRKLSQNVVPESSLCRKLSQTRMPVQT